MKQNKPVTYKEVMQRINNIKLEDMKSQDIFDRFIIYGNVAELNNYEVQKQIVKYDYTEYLINILGEITTNETIIAEMLQSTCFKNNNYTIVTGTIEDIEIVKKQELPNTFSCAIVTLLDRNTGNTLKIEYVDDTDNVKYNFKREYINKQITVVIQNMERCKRLCCFLKIK